MVGNEPVYFSGYLARNGGARARIAMSWFPWLRGDRWRCASLSHLICIQHPSSCFAAHHSLPALDSARICQDTGFDLPAFVLFRRLKCFYWILWVVPFAFSRHCHCLPFPFLWYFRAFVFYQGKDFFHSFIPASLLFFYIPGKILCSLSFDKVVVVKKKEGKNSFFFYKMYFEYF